MHKHDLSWFSLQLKLDPALYYIPILICVLTIGSLYKTVLCVKKKKAATRIQLVIKDTTILNASTIWYRNRFKHTCAPDKKKKKLLNEHHTWSQLLNLYRHLKQKVCNIYLAEGMVDGGRGRQHIGIQMYHRL